MNRILRRRPSPAMGVALIALFISLSGVSYAVATGSINSREIKNNTIRSKDVRNGTLRTQDIRNNQIRGFDIRNSTIRSPDVALNTLTGADINESKLGKVAAATSADKAATAQKAATADRATVADQGLTPVAYARIATTGDVLEANTRGLVDANVTREGLGSFCFRALGFQFKSAQVTVDYGSGASGQKEIAQVALGNPKAECAGAGVQLQVVTADAKAGVQEPHGFFIWFYD